MILGNSKSCQGKHRTWTHRNAPNSTPLERGDVDPRTTCRVTKPDRSESAAVNLGSANYIRHGFMIHHNQILQVIYHISKNFNYFCIMWQPNRGLLRVFHLSLCYIKQVRSSWPQLQLLRLSFELLTHRKGVGGGRSSMHSSCFYKCMLTPC